LSTKKILGSVKTRWLSQQPAVSRIIDLYPALKSYFMSQEKCPAVLRTILMISTINIWKEVYSYASFNSGIGNALNYRFHSLYLL